MTQGLKYVKLNKMSDGQYQNVKILVHSYTVTLKKALAIAG